MKDNIEIINLTPKFLHFYENAKNQDDETRWISWKENYNFAAVPPGEQGEEMAKRLLKQSWSKYPQIISYLETWTPNTKKIEEYLQKIKSLLGYNQCIEMALIYYVGSFEHNSFVAPYSDGRIALCLPIETGEDDVILIHELTHIVHSKTAEFTSNWERSIATVIVQEGLAMQVSKYLVPGKEDETYIEYKKGWLESCRNQSEDVLKGILPYLEESSYERVYQFTIGEGTTGNEREAYFIGWKLIDKLLKNGMSFKAIGEIKEFDMADIVRKAME